MSMQGVVTVLLQDYFHRGVFRTLIGEKQWSRFQSRLDRDVDSALRLLDQFNLKATFFALGWIGEQFPTLIRRLADEGHEIASAGYWARAISEMTPNQFRDDIRRARAALQSASGRMVIGYRCAYRYIRPQEKWALSILLEEGHIYDASCCPPIVGRDPFKLLRGACGIETPSGIIRELPISTKSLLGLNLSISGGNYLRQLPHGLMLGFFEDWLRRRDAPFVLYFHPWELDEEQPFINAIGFISRMKQYRNLGKMRTMLPEYFKRAHFMSIRDYLGIEPGWVKACTADPRNEPRQPLEPTGVTSGYYPRKSVSVIVPCYNEVSSLPYLENALAELETAAKPSYEMKFVFVDDCSTDHTLEGLRSRFGSRSNCTVKHHKANRGIARAIETGICASDTAIVCSIDADCSYDPLELIRMIPELDEKTDLVTASPYHPRGFVLAVPGWRLVLSRSLSRLYHLVLRHKLYTYTSCFRVYRKSAVANIRTNYGDFRGIVELLARLDISGGTIKEFPTTIQSRIFGYSKMKTLKTILGHLKLLLGILSMKVRRRHR
jgi:polysaccharide deacetylase family protein (PEP-CTERM system associated)